MGVTVVYWDQLVAAANKRVSHAVQHSLQDHVSGVHTSGDKHRGCQGAKKSSCVVQEGHGGAWA